MVNVLKMVPQSVLCEKCVQFEDEHGRLTGQFFSKQACTCKMTELSEEVISKDVDSLSML